MRDGMNRVYGAIKKGKLGGYWYIAEREKNWKSSEYGFKSSPDKAKILEEWANKLRKEYEKKLLETKRFKNWYEAVKNVGLVYMLAERLFYILGTLSLLVIRSRIIRKSKGIAVPMLAPIWKDVCKLGLFFFISILIPILLWLNIVPDKVYTTLPFIGFFIVILVFQHNVNVVVFDSFRVNRLTVPKPGGEFWHKLDKWSSYIIPEDSRKLYMSSYILTSGKRRIVLAVMDFWLMLNGFALIYATGISDQFNTPICDFMSALYFSVIAGLTVGFGDLYPVTDFSRALVVFQIFSCFLFAIIIIAYMVGLIPKSQQLEE